MLQTSSNAHAARQGRERCAGAQHDVDAAREQRVIRLPVRCESGRQAIDRQQNRVRADLARPAGSCGRGRTRSPARSGSPRFRVPHANRPAAVANSGMASATAKLHAAAPGTIGAPQWKPIHAAAAAAASIQPDRRIVIEQGQQHRSRGRRQWRGRREVHAGLADAARAAPSRRARRESSVCAPATGSAKPG